MRARGQSFGKGMGTAARQHVRLLACVTTCHKVPYVAAGRRSGVQQGTGAVTAMPTWSFASADAEA
jgi:hypothetical protein